MSALGDDTFAPEDGGHVDGPPATLEIARRAQRGRDAGRRYDPWRDLARTVVDEGAGLPPEVRAALDEEFRREHADDDDGPTEAEREELDRVFGPLEDDDQTEEDDDHG